MPKQIPKKLPKSIPSRSNLSQDDADKIVFSAATKIAEMFDGVVILATRTNANGETQLCQFYEGNAFTTRALLEYGAAAFDPMPEPKDAYKDDHDD